jgi:starch synthase
MLPMMEYEGCVNYMKGAVESANAVTTVSPTYANELRYSFYAYGLSPIINRNMNKLTGILNGIDTSLYDPRRIRISSATSRRRTLRRAIFPARR